MRADNRIFFFATILIAIASAMPASAQPVDVSACRMPPGAALAPEKDRQRAIEACSRVIGDAALPASVRSDALLTRAGIYSLLSAMDLKTAVEIDPANIALRKRRGYHYFTIERFDQAIEDYNEGDSSGPKRCRSLSRARRRRAPAETLQRSDRRLPEVDSAQTDRRVHGVGPMPRQRIMDERVFSLHSGGRRHDPTGRQPCRGPAAARRRDGPWRNAAMTLPRSSRSVLPRSSRIAATRPLPPKGGSLMPRTDLESKVWASPNPSSPQSKTQANPACSRRLPASRLPLPYSDPVVGGGPGGAMQSIR